MAIVRIGQITGETQSASEFTMGNFGSVIPVLSSTKAKTGTYSWRWSNQDPFGFGFDSTTTIRANYFLNHNGWDSNDEPFLFSWTTDDGVNNFIDMKGDSALTRIVYNNSIVASVSTESIGLNAVDTWFSLGLYIYTHGSSGIISLYVDGVKALTYTGNTGTEITGLFIGGTSSGPFDAYAYGDDFYVDSAIGESDEVPPSKRFLYTAVSGNGTNSNWNGSDGNQVNNYEMVDEAPPDDDTTYLTVNSAAQKDDYTVSGVTVPTGYQIDAAIPIAKSYRSNVATASTLKLYSYDGVTYQASGEKTLPADYGYVFERQEAQPDTSSWNETDFNAMEFGMESSGSY